MIVSKDTMIKPRLTVSSWPFKAALISWCVLTSLCAALLLSLYLSYSSELKQQKRHLQQGQQSTFAQYTRQFRQQGRVYGNALQAAAGEFDAIKLPAQRLDEWWVLQGQSIFRAIEWVDNKERVQWREGVGFSSSQITWLKQKPPLNKYRATILCRDALCEELSVLPISHQNRHVGEIRARRDISPLLNNIALATGLELGILDAHLESNLGWQASSYAQHQLSQQQLITLAEPALLQQLKYQPQAIPAITADEATWSLLSFPKSYARNLYLVARSAPSSSAHQTALNYGLYGLLCLVLNTAIAYVVWSICRGFSRRLQFYARLPPLLSEGKYQHLREKLIPLKTISGISDFTPLEDSLNTLSYQLESLDKAVDVRNQEMERLSLFDSLSGLPNRHLLQYEIQNDLRSLRHHNKEGIVAVIILDLDKFKRINDSLGHQLGDQILEKMGKRLKGNIRSLGVVARLGGDEFAVLLRSIKRVDQLQSTCQKILELVNKPLVVENTTLVISCSIGVSVASIGDTYNDLLKHAEIAMYKAKDAGGNYYRLFNAEMASELDLNLSLEGEIRRGFSEEEYTLYLQPKVNMNGVIKGFESLIRWDHPDRGVLPPGEFIPAMETMGFISQLDNWVLEASCRQLKVLEPHYPEISIAVNISSTHFTDHNFLVFLQSCLAKYPINPNKLELEITETLLMENMSAGREVIDKIKQMGVRIAIDDFGTGYSSLSYLKKLPVDTLKIDREFIKDIPDSESDMQISSVIIFLAKQLNFCVVAEGVETSEQLVFLKASHCDLAQGFYFSKPIPAHKAILMLESERIDLSQQRSAEQI